MPDIVYLQLGSEGLAQFEIAAKNMRKVEPQAKIILYTDQTERKLQQQTYDEYRYWPHPLNTNQNSTFGTTSFGHVTLEKPRVILDALQKCSDWILFSDVDIIALKPFTIDINQTLSRKKFWVSCEGNEIHPRNHCTGLIAISPHNETVDLIKKWILHHKSILERDETCHDQTAFNSLIHSEPKLENRISVFPLGYAMPGWLFPLMYPIQSTRVTPTFFHCNWVKGHSAKLKRLIQIDSINRTRQTWPRFVKGLFVIVTQRFAQNRPPFRFWRSFD